jgi:hypothetical protein
LIIFPVAVRLPITTRLSADIYAAWADGTVEQGNRIFVLNGFVDTRVRALFQASPWAVVSVAAKLPTGNASHTPDEALVASILASDLLGFQETNWGTGFGITSGIATARQAGEWGLGLGVSYSLAQDFEPEEGSPLRYEPGNEARLRLALDRNVGTGGKFTAGFTFQNYTEDQLKGSNLFQAGNRLRGDVSYAFRVGGSTWSAFAMNSWRAKGDVLGVLGDGVVSAADTTIQTGTQNNLVVGFSGSVRVGSSLRIRPLVDLRIQSREEDEGSGWLVGVGGDVPFSLLRSLDAFPLARVQFGKVEAQDGSRVSFIGGEFGLTLRFR